MSATNVVIKGSAFVSRFTVRPEKREDFTREFAELRALFEDVMQRDAHFVFYGWARNDNEWVAIESWRSEAAVNAVRATAEFQNRVGQLLALCSKDMEMEVFSGMADQAARSIFALYPKGKSQVHPSLESVGTVFL